jgi:hyperosmotically inducible protein
MNPESSLKIRVASGMAVVLALIAGTVALRSHHSTSAAQIAQPSAAVAPIADAPAAVAPIPDAPAAVAPIPDASVANTNKDSVAKTGDAASPAAVEPKVASNRHPAKAQSSVDTPETLDKKRVDGVNSAREQMMPSAASGTAEAPKSDELAALDGVITTEVKSQLAADSIGKDVDIGVTTTHGIVVLTGTVLTQDAIDHARGVAEKVKDVKSVDTSAMMIPAT